MTLNLKARAFASEDFMEKHKETNFDLVVVGAGPAGLTAGMYGARQGLKVAIVTGEVGGQAAWASEIENYLGWRLVSGTELVQNFRDHVSQFGVICFEGELINGLIPTEEGFDLFTREGTALKAKAIVLATGRTPNRLSVPGEQEFIGRGVSYCATCDGAFFRSKSVAVVGSVESAADAALALATLGAQVHMILNGPVRIPQVLMSQLKDNKQVLLYEKAKVQEILGDESVTGIRITHSDTKDDQDIPVAGVFIETGSIAASEFTGGLIEMNAKGEIITGKDGATNVKGIYAAGDVTDNPGKQIIIAAGSGALAAMSVSRYLKRK